MALIGKNVGLTEDGNVGQGETFPMLIGNFTWGVTVACLLHELGTEIT